MTIEITPVDPDPSGQGSAKVSGTAAKATKALKASATSKKAERKAERAMAKASKTANARAKASRTVKARAKAGNAANARNAANATTPSTVTTTAANTTLTEVDVDDTLEPVDEAQVTADLALVVTAPERSEPEVVSAAPVTAEANSEYESEFAAEADADVVTEEVAASPQPALKASRLRTTPPDEQPTVLSVPQRVGLIVLGLAAVVGLAVALVPTLVAITAALVVFFIAANVMKLVLITRALNDNQQVVVDAAGNRMADADLPVYTILLPVYHEAEMLTQLVDGILALDYPVDRLDVKLLLEEDDTETREAATGMALPSCFDVLVIPDVGPTGKPRACNHGLRHARGRYLVIYDAEDRPEPDQLRKSVLAFRDAPDDVICLQAQLNYFNRSYNLLTRWFTAEYSVWFDQLLPGLQSMDVPIPLGGTSNHFITARLDELGGWNAFNVTEDADLGLRIYLAGWKTAILATTTYEEATSRYHNWIRQRSRWTKGYMQTYLFHMRHPFRLAREMGLLPFMTFQLFFGASTLCLLLNPLFWLLAGMWFAFHLHLIEQLFPAPVMYLGTIALFVGNAACVLSAVSGCFGRRNYEDVKYAFLVPFYWVLMSVGAWKALIQLCYKPSYWEKTEHGFCLYEEEDAEGAALDDRVPVGALSAS